MFSRYYQCDLIENIDVVSVFTLPNSNISRYYGESETKSKFGNQFQDEFIGVWRKVDKPLKYRK